MITTARETKDGWVLNGAKMWITNGSQATVAIVWAKTGETSRTTKSIRGFIVPTGTKGFTARDQKGKLSLRASDTSELVLEDVRVPKDAILPKSGGIKSPLMCLTQARYGIAWGGRGRGDGLLRRGAALLEEPDHVRPAHRPDPDPAGPPGGDADRDHQGAVPGAPAGPAQGPAVP